MITRVEVRDDWITKTTKPSRLFLDSGAHSLYNWFAFPIKSPHRRYDFYKTPEFWKYVDAYATFVKEHEEVIEHYANVDVIHNPEMSWEVQKYLEEEHGLHPVPVIHSGTPLSWVVKHVEAGYDYIGLGGISKEGSDEDYIRWADQVYDLLCSNLNRTPVVKTHGFANTSYTTLIRYPWFSVDSASWAKAAAYGNVFIPHKRKGEFTFEEAPYIVCFSWKSPAAKKKGKHFTNYHNGERKIMQEWLEMNDFSIGEVDKDGKIITQGVSNHYGQRALANMLFFDKVREWLPEWPWSFKATVRKGFFH